MFFRLRIVIYPCDKNEQDALFYAQFISIINLYMLQEGLLLETCRNRTRSNAWHHKGHNTHLLQYCCHNAGINHRDFKFSVL